MMAIWRTPLCSTRRKLFFACSWILTFLVIAVYAIRVSRGIDEKQEWDNLVTIPRDAHSLSLRESVANSTLGFESIVALSQGTRWRVDGLQAAAALTDLSILIPPNPRINPDQLAAFHQPGRHRLGTGSAIAWLAHLNLLRYVIGQGYETVLIMEDDADWDVSLKDQMKRVSDAMRALCGEDSSDFECSGTTSAPYGCCWDVLWIGNCGDNVAGDVSNLQRPASPRIRIWKDNTMVPQQNYSGFAHNAVMLLPEGMRSVVSSRGPVCTFAYAITHAAAKQLVEFAAVGDDEAYDTKLSKICESGLLNCFTVTPEVIHEYTPPPAENGSIHSEVNAANGQGTQAGDLLTLGMGSTLNIVKSARCAAVYNGSTCFPGRVET